MRKRALAATAVILAAVTAFAWSPGRRYWRAGKLLSALSHAHAAGAPAEAAGDVLLEETLTVDGAGGSFRARDGARRAGGADARDDRPGRLPDHASGRPGDPRRRRLPARPARHRRRR